MIQGAYMMFRRDIYKEIGGFDERIPMFLEDGEYCLRLSRHGYKIRYLADAAIIHYAGQSTQKSEPRRIASLRYEANCLFLREYQGRVASALYLFFVFLGTPFKLLLLPLFGLGLRIKSGNSRLRLYFWETISGWFWLASKMHINHRGANPRRNKLSFDNENSI
jgi:GT2 family glycosyltransferase